MPYYVLTSIIDAAICFAVASLLFFRARRQTWDLVLLLYGIAFWASLPWMIYLSPGGSEFNVTQHFYDLIVFIPVCLVLFALRTMDRSFAHPLLKIAVVLSAAFSLTHRFPGFIQGLRNTSEGVFPIPGPIFTAFSLYYGWASLYAVWSVFRAYQVADSWRKTRLQWIGVAFMFANIGAVIHFYSIYRGVEPISHDLFTIASVSIFAYGIFKRRLYDIQLITREAACTIVTVLLSAAPLILGRVFAPIVEDLPSQSRLAAMMTLFATLSFFAIGITLVRYADHRSTRQLSRFFLLSALLNAVFFIWAVPKNAFTIPVVRLSYMLGGLAIFAWIDYRRSALDEPMDPAPLYITLWKACSFCLFLLAASTPWVLRYLEYYRTTARPFAVVTGPLHIPLHLWIFLTPIIVGGWIEWRVLKAARFSIKMETGILWGSMILANGASIAFSAFGFGKINWPLPMVLEMIAAAGILIHFLRQPHGGRRPSPTILMAVFFSTLIACLSGFMLFYGLWTQLVACVLLAFAMPKILSEFQGSAQALVDQYLFRSKFSYLAEIQRIGDDLFQGTHLPMLLARLAQELTQRTELVWAGIWLFDLSEGRFLLRQAAGDKNTQLTPIEAFKFSFAPNDALVACLKKEKGLVLASDLLLLMEDQRLPPEALESLVLVELMRTDLAATFPIFMGTKFIGFLGFGRKAGEPGFHQADREKLSELGKKAEHAIGQAYMLYEQSLMFSKLAQDTLDFLQAMGMNIDILRNEYLGALNEKQKKQLDIAAQQKEYIRSTLTDLRELERLMVLRMQGTWHMSHYDLKHLIEQSLRACGPRLTTQGVALLADLHNVPELVGDGRALHRAIDNLLSHAFTLTPANESVSVELRHENSHIRLQVITGGPGVDPEDVERLFDPFYKGRPGTPLAYGTGLGLSVVKEVVTLHQGRVWAENQPGKGTVFTVELPVANGAAPTHTEKSE